MCYVKRYLLLFVVFASLCISGCEEELQITSADPDPDTVIYANPKENIVFSVDGVFVTDFFISDSEWAVAYKQWELDVDNHLLIPMGKKARLHVSRSQSYNVIGVTFALGYYDVDTTIPWFDQIEVDKKEWTVKIIPPQGETVWEGDYLAENDYDIELLQGYTTIEGELRLEGSFSTDGLEKLKNIDSVESLYVVITETPGLEDLGFLSELEHVYKYIFIQRNDSISSLKGLEKVVSASDFNQLNITDNDSLVNLDALQGMKTIEYLEVKYNPELTDLSGLNALTTVKYAEFYSNASLESLGLDSLCRISTSMTVSYNPALCSYLVDDLAAQVETCSSVSPNVTQEGNKECESP